LRIAVIDGQGGGIGKAIVDKLRKEMPEDTEIIALGTNYAATVLMLKAGANEGATGEGAIVYNASRVDVIIGTIGIIVSNAMMGELTTAMAKAISESPAKKILIPLNRCNIDIAGVKSEPLPHQIENAVSMIKSLLQAQNK
jgi:NAD(P)-dependent dehydrogenase (short-subunit alcohol dehydrogenase family)